MNNKIFNLSCYKLNLVPYTVPIDKFSEQIQESNYTNFEKSQKLVDNLDSMISAKIDECAHLATEVEKLYKNNSEIKTELDALKKKEDRLSHSNFDLRNGNHRFFSTTANSIWNNCDLTASLLALKKASKQTFVQNNEIFRTHTQKIQMNLGLKLKLLQGTDNQHIWTAKFVFDSNEMENDHFVVISYNTQDNSFTCLYYILLNPF